MADVENVLTAIRQSLQQKGWVRVVFRMSDAHSLIPDFLYENLKLEATEEDLVLIDELGAVHYISVGTIEMKMKDPNEPGKEKKD